MSTVKIATASPLMPAARKPRARVEDLFLEAAPQPPPAPRRSWKLRLSKGMKWGAPFTLPVLGGAAGWLAGTASGGWATAAGVAAGLLAIPVTGVAGLLVTVPLVAKVTDSDGACNVTGLGVLGLAALSSPVAGYFIGAGASGTWWGIGTAAAAGIGGLVLGLGLTALLDDSDLECEYEHKLHEHETRLEKYHEGYAAWEKRCSKALSEQQKARLTIERDEKKVVVGGVTLGRKPGT